MPTGLPAGSPAHTCTVIRVQLWSLGLHANRADPTDPERTRPGEAEVDAPPPDEGSSVRHTCQYGAPRAQRGDAQPGSACGGTVSHGVGASSMSVERPEASAGYPASVETVPVPIVARYAGLPSVSE